MKQNNTFTTRRREAPFDPRAACGSAERNPVHRPTPNVILGLLGSRPDYRNTNRTAGLQALPLRDPESPSRAA